MAGLACRQEDDESSESRRAGAHDPPPVDLFAESSCHHGVFAERAKKTGMVQVAILIFSAWLWTIAETQSETPAIRCPLQRSCAAAAIHTGSVFLVMFHLSSPRCIRPKRRIFGWRRQLHGVREILGRFLIGKILFPRWAIQILICSLLHLL